MLFQLPPLPLWAQREATEIADVRWVDRAVSLRAAARPVPWLRGREHLFTECVRPARRMRIPDRRLATIAIRLRPGWVYVDTSGTVFGALRGVFAYDRWMANLARHQSVPAEFVLSRVTLNNETTRPITVRDQNGGFIVSVGPRRVITYPMYQSGQWFRTPSGAKTQIAWYDVALPSGVFRRTERGGDRIYYTVRKVRDQG